MGKPFTQANNFIGTAAFDTLSRGVEQDLSKMAMQTPERLAELAANAQKLCAPGKGFLAADESAGPWLRAGHAEAAKIPDTIENRAAYRSMCFTTPGLSENISGVIMHVETLHQKDASGNNMVDLVING